MFWTWQQPLFLHQQPRRKKMYIMTDSPQISLQTCAILLKDWAQLFKTNDVVS